MPRLRGIFYAVVYCDGGFCDGGFFIRTNENAPDNQGAFVYAWQAGVLSVFAVVQGIIFAAVAFSAVTVQIEAVVGQTDTILLGDLVLTLFD